MDKKFIGITLMFIIFIGVAFAATATLVMPGQVDTTIQSGVSIVAYLKTVNANIVTQTSQLTSTDVKDIKDLSQKTNALPVDTAAKAPVENKGAATVTWTNLLGGQTSAVIFPQVTIDGKPYQLRLGFQDRKLATLGNAFLIISVNRGEISCYLAGGTILNPSALVAPSALLFGWGEGHEVCEATTYKNFYALDATLSSNNSYKQFALTSPLIPTACNGKSFSQANAVKDASGMSVLTVTCE